MFFRHRRRLRGKAVLLATGLVLGALVVLPDMAFAATHSQTAPGESNLGFLFAGFGVAWIAFFAYAFYIGQKNRELRRDIEELREQLAKHDAAKS